MEKFQIKRAVIAGSARKNKRIWEIDFIRGCCVILMILDHLAFDFWSFGYDWMNFLTADSWLYRMYSFTEWLFQWDVYWICWYVVVCLFISTSGISSNFSRSNVSRGLKLAGVALFISFGTAMVDKLFQTSLIVRFGVIHCYAVCILLCEGWKRLTKAYPMWARIVLTVAVSAPILIYGMRWLNNPVYLQHNWLSIFGLTTKDYYSSDYFPIFPWLAVFLLGNIVGQVFYARRRTLLPEFDTGWYRPVAFVGRHALIIYVLHQIVFGGIFLLAGMILGYQ